MKLTLLRHAESEYNEKGILQGRIDCNLSLNGLNQARERVKTFDSSKYDVCFCSPLKRTSETAKILVPNLQIIYDDRLIERCLGDWEDAPISNEMNFLLSLDDTIPPNGESKKDLASRVTSFIEFLKRNYEDKKILIITHGGVINATLTILGMPKTEINNLEFFTVDIEE